MCEKIHENMIYWKIFFLTSLLRMLCTYNTKWNAFLNHYTEFCMKPIKMKAGVKKWKRNLFPHIKTDAKFDFKCTNLCIWKIKLNLFYSNIVFVESKSNFTNIRLWIFFPTAQNVQILKITLISFLFTFIGMLCEVTYIFNSHEIKFYTR